MSTKNALICKRCIWWYLLKFLFQMFWAIKLNREVDIKHLNFWDKWLSMLSYYDKRLTCKAYWVIVVLCWNLFCSCLVLFLFLSSPICHFPISCLMTAGSSSIITFTELSANVRGNSILLNHRESGLEKLQNVQKLARWFTALKYCWGVLFEHALPLYCRIIIEMRHGICGW